MNVSRPVIAFLFLPLLISPAAWGADPSFQVLDGFNWTTAISADGSVVVGKRATLPKPPGGLIGEYDYEAVRWENGVVTSLGDLPGGDDDSTAYGVSADGSVIVGYGHSDAGQEAVMWNNGVLTSLGVLTGYETSEAYDVSADGTVVVGRAVNLSSIGHTADAWRWEGGVMTDLELTAGSVGLAQAKAVSADGSVVVGDRFGGGSFRWDSGVLTTLGSPEPMGVSADGSVVVGGIPVPGITPWRWVDGATTELGLLPGTTTGRATDVSADGSVIVGTVFTGDLLSGLGDAFGFVWTLDGGMRYVGDLLIDDYGLDLDGWMLGQVVAISDDGQTIVGNAIKTVETGFPQYPLISGWIAHIPEPGSLLLLAVGASTVLRRRDRVRWRSVGTAGM